MPVFGVEFENPIIRSRLAICNQLPKVEVLSLLLSAAVLHKWSDIDIVWTSIVRFRSVDRKCLELQSRTLSGIRAECLNSLISRL